MLRAACLLVIAITASAQPPDPVIRATTSLVQVRVAVLDSHNQPVPGLAREDFQILHDRHPQPFTLFVPARGNPRPPVPAAGDRPATPAPSSPASAVLLLDWLNTKYTDRLLVHDRMVEWLQNREPTQNVAIYLLAHQPRLLHDFTTDRAGLLKAVHLAIAEPVEQDDESISRFDARYGNRPLTSVQEQLFNQVNQVRGTLRSFEMLADRLSRMPGRKTLVWLSAGFPLAINARAVPGARPGGIGAYNFVPDLEKAIVRLNRADVGVYSVDARGLTITTPGYLETLRELASRTGGTTFYDRNDLDEGIRLALDDLRESYVLGFHVPEGAAPGVREIHVTVKRAGVHLRYRESYELVAPPSVK